jgi:hypothetical protein
MADVEEIETGTGVDDVRDEVAGNGKEEASAKNGENTSGVWPR